MLLCSCNMNKDEQLSEELSNDEQPGGMVRGTLPPFRPIKIVILDKAQNDRLNPESPSYFGKDYSNGIEVFYLYNGIKRTFLEYYYLIGGGTWYFIDNVEKIKPIFPPYRKTVDYGDMSYGTLGYFFVDISWYPTFEEDDLDVSYAYIQYPDGSEDVIKCEYSTYYGEKIYCREKIWINGELVFQLRYKKVIVESLSTPDEPFIFNQAYFNPKYYPWLEPVFLGGIQVGVQPKEGTDIIVLTK